MNRILALIAVALLIASPARAQTLIPPQEPSPQTGTGSWVRATSPTLVTPALGTPSALVGTNISGTAANLTAGNVTTNANSTGAVTSVGNATSLGSFSSANLLGALTDKQGSGLAVFATSPTLTTPEIGAATGTTLVTTGAVTAGTNLLASAAGQIRWTGRGILTSGTAGTIQSGDVDAASPTAQTFSAQSVVTGTSNTAGANWTFRGSRGTGTGAGGSISFQTAPAGSTGTAQNAAVTALSIDSAGLVTLPLIASDATHTDQTLCIDTTTHAIYRGSGTVGICLGSSSVRYKRNVRELGAGLPEILKLKPVTFRYIPGRGDNGERQQVGFIAEDVAKVLPGLTGLDVAGLPNAVDILGMVPVLVRAVQQLEARVRQLEAAR